MRVPFRCFELATSLFPCDDLSPGGRGEIEVYIHTHTYVTYRHRCIQTYLPAYIYMHTYVHTCMHTCSICAGTHACIYAYTHKCNLCLHAYYTYTWAQACADTCHTDMHAIIHTHVLTRTQTCLRKFVQLCAYVHTSIQNISTYTQAVSLLHPHMCTCIHA